MRVAQAGVAARASDPQRTVGMAGRDVIKSITGLAFAAAILGAATMWMAGRLAVVDQADSLNRGAAPLGVTQATRAAERPSDGPSEDNAGKNPDDSSPHRPVPLMSPLSADPIELMSDGLLHWYDDGLHGGDVANSSNFVRGSQSNP